MQESQQQNVKKNYRMEANIVHYISDKEIVLKICKDLIQLSNKTHI